MSVPVPFTGPLVSTETTKGLLTCGTSCEMSGLHFGLPVELFVHIRHSLIVAPQDMHSHL